MNPRVHRVLIYCFLALTVAGLLGLFGIKLEEKFFNFIPWKIVLVVGIGYIAWAINKLLHF